MSRKTLIAALLVVSALMFGLTACGGDDDGATDTGAADTSGESAEESVEVDLGEQNGSGQTGTATLTSTGDGKTQVTIELSNPPADPQPAHIHKGTCIELDPTPAFPLESVEGGSSDTEVEVSLEDLQGAEYAVNVHKSEADAQTYVACGNIVGGDSADAGSGAGGGGGAGY
jgi:hypothetical protein